MATIEKNIKKGQYLKKTDTDSYVHYHFDTDDSVVYLSEKIDGADGNGVAYAKDATLHDTLCALYTLASKGGQASTDLATLTQKVNAHITNKNNPHGVTKQQVGLGNVVNATMDNTPTENSDNYVKSGGVYTAIKNASNKADQAISIANGQSRAYVFANIAGLKSGTLSNNQPIQSGYKVGDSIYIIAPNVSDFWISGFASTGNASTDNDIQTAKKGQTIVVKWGAAYVSLTAFESKRDLNGYVTTSALSSALGNYYDKTTSDGKYVPYSGATKSVNLGDNTLTFSDGAQTNPTFTEISKGKIVLNGKITSGGAARRVEINCGGIRIDDRIYDYPEGIPSPLATQGFVADATKEYQTADQVKNLINTGTVKLKGDVTGNGKVNDGGMNTTLSTTGITPGTYSALTVDAKGRATAGYQQIIFAPTIDDDHLNRLAIGGVAIIDA